VPVSRAAPANPSNAGARATRRAPEDLLLEPAPAPVLELEPPLEPEPVLEPEPELEFVPVLLFVDVLWPLTSGKQCVRRQRKRGGRGRGRAYIARTSET